MTKEILNSNEAASYLRLNEQTIRAMAREGKVPAFKVGKSWRFNKSALDALYSGQESVQTTKKQILVIDDDEWVHHLIQASVNNDDYSIHCAENGIRGLEILRRQEIDFVFLDLVMPEMTGPDVLAVIRQEWENMPVTIVTSHSDSSMMENVLSFSPLIVLAKPFSSQQVQGCLQAITNKD